jgi:hypothetical protein
MGEHLTSLGEKKNVSKSDTSESQRLLLQPSPATKTTAFKGHIRTQSFPPSVEQERAYQIERVWYLEPSQVRSICCNARQERKRRLPFTFKKRSNCGVKWWWVEKARVHNNKVNQTYHLREFCGGGNNEPKDTLKNVECSEITTSRPTRAGNAPLVSKGVAKDKRNPHPGEGAASRRAWWILEWRR